MCSRRRTLFGMLGLLFVLICSSGRLTAQGTKQWFERSLVGMEVGPTGAQFGYSDISDTRYAAKFDGAQIVREAKSAHAEYLVLWVRDGDFAYYNSSILPKAPGLTGKDPLRDAVKEARYIGMPLLAYCVVQQAGHFLKAHPEFEMIGANRQRIGRFCFNSGYLEAIKQIVKEQLDYGIDGFHIDMVDQGFGPPYGCYCDTCRKLFENKYKHVMPRSVSWDSSWHDFLQFRYWTSAHFEQELYKYIKSVNPRATVDFNYHGNPPFSFEVGQLPVMHAVNADFNTGETGQWGFSALGVSLNSEFYRAATPGKPFQVAMQRGVRMYHDQTTRPLNDMRWELMTLLSHGAFVTMVDKTGFDGTRDLRGYERIGKAFAEVQAKRKDFGHAPIFDVGIFYSHLTRDIYGKDNSAEYYQSFQGVQKTCVYEHIPYGVVLSENMDLKTLRQFKVICIPNAVVLSSRDIELFRKYVELGGNLVITGKTGIWNEAGHIQSNPSYASLIGATVKSELQSLDNWIDFSGTKSPGELDRSSRCWLVKGPAVAFEKVTASTSGSLLAPYRTTRQISGQEGTSWPMSPEKVVGPAILTNKIGSGVVVTFAGSPDYSVASEHHVSEVRKEFAAVILKLMKNRQIKIDAPANVETVVTDDAAGKTLRVHCISYNSLPQSIPAHDRPFVLPGLTEDAPMYTIKIHINRKFKSVSSFSKSSKWTINGRTITGIVNDIHDVVRIRY